MSIAQTSLEAHQDIQLDGISAHQQRLILAEVRKHPKGLTRREIARNTGMSAGSVGGRCNLMMGITLRELRGADIHRSCSITGKRVKLVYPK